MSKRPGDVQAAVMSPAWCGDLFRVGHWSDYIELTKPRVTLLVLVTTLVGFYLATSGPLKYLALFHTLLGTALAAAGSATLNQFLERVPDKRMRRTENRPLPAGRLEPGRALWFGLFLSLSGLVYLVLLVNWLASLLTLLVLISYLFLYTPLKQKTSLCTMIGAIPGAIPPMIGWAGARGHLGMEAWTLFLIMFLWQFPHFLSIAWLYREDYERGGYRMLPLQDETGFITGQQILVYTLALVPVSLLPTVLGTTGWIYLAGAIALGLFFLHYGYRAAQSRTTRDARRLLKASVVYLPALLILMVLDKAN